MLRNRRIRLGSGFAIALAILLASTSVVQANNLLDREQRFRELEGNGVLDETGVDTFGTT